MQEVSQAGLEVADTWASDLAPPDYLGQGCICSLAVCPETVDFSTKVSCYIITIIIVISKPLIPFLQSTWAFLP